MRYAIMLGVFAFWFLMGNLIASWIDGNSTLAATSLTVAASSSQTSITVDTTYGFPPAPDYIILDNELSTYSGMDATHFTGLTRGVSDPNEGFVTLAAAHTIGTPVQTPQASILATFLGFNANAISTSYGSFSIIDFGVGAYNFLRNIPRWISFDYPFLRGPYNPITQQNEMTDIIIVRLALIAIFTVPGIVGLILILRTIFFRGTV